MHVSKRQDHVEIAQAKVEVINQVLAAAFRSVDIARGLYHLNLFESGLVQYHFTDMIGTE